MEINSKVIGTPVKVNRKSPRRLASLSQDVPTPISHVSEVPGLGALKKQILNDEASFKLEKGRQFMEHYLDEIFSQISDKMTEKQKQQISLQIKEVATLVEFEEYLPAYFTCYNKCYRELLLQKEVGVLKIPLDLKMRKKVLLTRDRDTSKSPKKGKLERALEENDLLKKELFRLRQSSLTLQKRILQLITQYKDRKMIYLSEIQRLATLINTTIQDIPKLIVQPFPKDNRRAFSAEKLLPPEEDLMLTKKESDYNTLSTSDALRWGLTHTFKAVQECQKESSQVKHSKNILS